MRPNYGGSLLNAPLGLSPVRRPATPTFFQLHSCSKDVATNARLHSVALAQCRLLTRSQFESMSSWKPHPRLLGRSCMFELPGSHSSSQDKASTKHLSLKRYRDFTLQRSITSHKAALGPISKTIKPEQISGFMMSIEAKTSIPGAIC